MPRNVLRDLGMGWPGDQHMTLLAFRPPFNGRTFQILGIFAQHDIDAIQQDLPPCKGIGLYLIQERPKVSDAGDQT